MKAVVERGDPKENKQGTKLIFLPELILKGEFSSPVLDLPYKLHLDCWLICSFTKSTWQIF